MKYVVVYDISNTKIRTKIYKLLSAYGKRVQFSCFEIKASPTDIKKLKKKISEVIDHDTDRVFIFPISLHAVDMIQKLGVIEELDKSEIL
ncbi:CRISPR-associated endonuclease Cas2 [Desulfurobacterium sp.]